MLNAECRRQKEVTQELPTIDLAGLETLGPDLNLDQYLGLWAIDEGRFLLLFDQVARSDLIAHVQARDAESPQAAARVGRRQAQDVAVAVIEINGTMTKRGSSLSAAGSTVRIRQAVRQAARDETIGGIVLRIDSPGGTVAGTSDLAREVAAADRQKPVLAYIEDLTASAAYWVASQARKVFANDRTAMVGSIGTYAGLYDYSGYAAARGIRPVVIRSGQYKAAGFPGTEITPEQREYWQELIDKTQAEFTAGVAGGRKLSVARVAELADGRIHLAEDAQQLGLIDGIQTFEETMDQLIELVTTRDLSKSRRKSMSEETAQSEAARELTPTLQRAEAPAQPAGFEELVAALPKASNDFLVEAQRQKMTVEQARNAWTERLQEEIAAKDREIAEARDATAAAKKTPGVEPLGNGAKGPAAESEYADPVAEFDKRVREQMQAGRTRQQAIKSVVKGDRDLHHAMLKASNAQHSKVQELIDERFELE